MRNGLPAIQARSIFLSHRRGTEEAKGDLRGKLKNELEKPANSAIVPRRNPGNRVRKTKDSVLRSGRQKPDTKGFDKGRQGPDHNYKKLDTGWRTLDG